MKWLICILLTSCGITLYAQEPRLMFSSRHMGGKENGSTINSIDFSPDQRFIITGARDGMVKIWDMKTGKLIYDILASDYSASGWFNRDGKYFITGEKGQPAVREISTGNIKHKLALPDDGFYNIIKSVTGKYFTTYSNVSPAYIWETSTGKLLDSGFIDEPLYYINNDKQVAFQDNGYLVIGNIGRAQEGFKLGRESEFISDYDISNNGKDLLIQYEDGSFEFWDVTTKTKKSTFQFTEDEPGFVKTFLSVSENKIITLDEKGRIHLFNARTGKKEKILTQELSGEEYRFRIDPAKKWLVFPSSDSVISIVPLNNPDKIVNVASMQDGIEKIAFSSDGSHMAYSWGNETVLINLHDRTQRFLGYASYTINKARIDSSGNTIALISDYLPDIKKWTWQTGGEIVNLKRRPQAYEHPKLLLNRSGNLLMNYSSQNLANLILWDLEKQAAIQMTDDGRKYREEMTKPYTGFFLSRTHQTIIQHDGYTRRYDWKTRKFSDDTIPGFSGEIQISPLENFAIAEDKFSGQKAKLKLVYLNTGKPTLLLPFSIDTVKQVVFSYDEKDILIASKLGSLTIWDTEKAKIKKQWVLRPLIEDAVFSHNGKYLLVHTTEQRNDAPSYDYNSRLLLYETTNWSLIKSWSKIGYTPENIWFNTDDRSVFTSEADVFTDNWQLGTADKSRQLTGSLGMDKGQYQPFDKFILTYTPTTTYIWDPKSLSLVYSLNIIDSNGFLARIPTGYFMSPPDAAKKLHYVTKDLKVVSFEQLDIKYNRPDKVLEKMGSADTALIHSYRRAYLKRISRLGIDTTAFREGFTVPDADVVDRDKISFEQSSPLLKLHIRGKAMDPVDRINIWINDVPVFTQKGINIRKQNKKQIDTSLTVTLGQGTNHIETSIIDVNGTESYRMPLVVNYNSPSAISKTYFIGIGIDQFADSRYNLQYSAKDIRDLAHEFQKKYGASIVIDTLFNKNVTVEKVKALKQKLMQASVNDKVIVAYSGHGLLSSAYDYYLSTFSVDFAKPEINGLAYDELESLLDGIPPRKKLMLIDACHSGEVDKDELNILDRKADSLGLSKGFKPAGQTKKQVGLINSFELMQSLFVNVGKSTGATVISAAAGNQYALERGDLRNGVFTFSILELMRKRQTLTISELRNGVRKRVEELTQGLQRPTTRAETKADDWKLW